MAKSERQRTEYEHPRNVDIVSVDILGRQTTFLVIHSAHFLSANTEDEVKNADALFLEGIFSPHIQDRFETLIDKPQYRRLAHLTTSSNALPIVSVDVDVSGNDLVKIGKEFLLETAGALGGAYLMHRAFVNARSHVTRRAFLQAAAGSALAFQPLVALFSAVADYRPGSRSGNLARALTALEDKNPLDSKVTSALRNRVFAYKSLLAAKFLMNGIPADPLWPPVPTDRLAHFPLLVGGRHTDIGRHLRRDSNDLRQEIVQMCKASEVSDDFLASATKVLVAKYDIARARWDIVVVTDTQVQR